MDDYDVDVDKDEEDDDDDDEKDKDDDDDKDVEDDDVLQNVENGNGPAVVCIDRQIDRQTFRVAFIYL